MQDALINALSSAETVDIEVAFFYFSGWQLLAKHLEDKKVRILVGKYIDPNAIPELLTQIKQEGGNVELDPYQPRTKAPSRVGKKKDYIDGFIKLSNESALMDDTDMQESYRILENKIADGTLEIKLTSTQEHGKMYIFHNKKELSQGGDLPGTVFMGSSNFTFQGLMNQGELNERYTDQEHYNNYVKKFDSLWVDSNNIDIATLENKDEILDTIKKELWLHAVPSPYSVYLRVLHELFGSEARKEVKTPEKITKGRYLDLEYQIDAIKAVMDRLNKYDGVILADVVGLGKSIIASAAAHNTGLNTIIIAPPHLREQWEDYQEEFKLQGARVFSSGALEDVHNRYKDNNEPILIIVDEAHRYRNEDTYDYRMLHHVCTSHPDNKVLLLTATPFNNDPKDVFALVKLFQIPGQSTIRSVDNLSLRFRELIQRYKKLNRDRARGSIDQEHIDKEADEISIELRRLVENIVVRRSRLDLRQITRYRENLKKQKIDFADVIGPELMTYDLNGLFDLYLDTLQSITGEKKEGGFIGARYKPTTYIKNRGEFMKVYGNFLEETDLQTAQTNLSKMMKRLLVMRFESSKDAFRSTLKNMIASTDIIEKWWNNLGKVPIMKKGQIPDPESILASTNDIIDEEIANQTMEKEFTKLRENKGLVVIDKDHLNESFIKDVQRDQKLLKSIYQKWFGEEAGELVEMDPKLDELQRQIQLLLSEYPERKIVIFSTYADTVNYLNHELSKRGLKRMLKYTAADSSRVMKKSVRCNFDAGLKESEQENEYDVLITTDALSEGFNLHRAGVIINYDIPYNPTRVIQRIGRINRINKKVFDKLYIYNFFPTETGESEIKIRQISTLKMRLINSVVGSDTKTLTGDEQLKSFFKDEYQKAESDNEVLSWDSIHREAYDQARKDKDLLQEALDIKPRSRVIRDGQDKNALVAFGKKGNHSLFALKHNGDAEIVAAEVALNYFAAKQDEKGKEADEEYDELFKIVRNELFAKHELPQIAGRRSDSLNVIRLIQEKIPRAKDYCSDLAKIIKEYDGINEGDLKIIAQLPVKNLEVAYKELRNTVPDHQVRSIIERASRLEGEYETIVLSEDIRL